MTARIWKFELPPDTVAVMHAGAAEMIREAVRKEAQAYRRRGGDPC